LAESLKYVVMKLKKMFLGINRENMPDIDFCMMSLWFKLYYFINPQKKYVNNFGIKSGDVIVDYGCGPGSYLGWTTEAAGSEGKVYAVDIHKLAIKSVQRLISRKKLNNIIPVLAEGYSCGIKDNIADLIYAIDMFHMIGEVDPFLKELNRIIKKKGILILEYGHQNRESAKEKVNESGMWKIYEETGRHMRCKPIK
jgi:ubiquinone/menaquinone biosynthesis C-methylase UbiE